MGALPVVGKDAPNPMKKEARVLIPSFPPLHILLLSMPQCCPPSQLCFPANGSVMLDSSLLTLQILTHLNCHLWASCCCWHIGAGGNIPSGREERREWARTVQVLPYNRG